MARRWVHGPNLFIVGAPKCGTTSMAAYLDQHPDIYFADRKEPFFFSVDLPHARAITTEQDYLALFAKGEGQHYRAEGSTWYLYSRLAAKAIKQASPDARIIVMLRDPIDLIVSQFQYNLIKGNEDIDDIEQALLAEPERRAGQRVPMSNRITAALHYTAMVDFAPQLQRYHDVFGRERVHVVLFDDLNDTKRCVQRVLEFLELPALPSFDLTPANETAKLPRRRFKGLHRAMLSNTGLVGSVKKLLPKTLKSQVWSILDGVNRTRSSPAKPTISPARHATLAATLRPGIERLADMLDRDLSHWAGMMEQNGANAMSVLDIQRAIATKTDADRTNSL